MTVQDRDLLQVWAMRLSLGTTLIVVLLSWVNGVKTVDLLVRAGIAFGLMYLLMVGSLSLFERTAYQEPETEQTNLDFGRGEVIDFSVGDDDQEEPQEQEQEQDPKFPGQVDRNLIAGLPDSERQAEIVRRMGWGDS